MTEFISVFASIFSALLSILQLILKSDKTTIILLILITVLLGLLLLKCNLLINSIRYGLLEVFSQKDNTQKSNVKLSKKIRKAKEIKILFTTGAAFFGNFKTDLLKALKYHGDDIKVKVLIGAKAQLFLNDVNGIEGRPPKENINSEVDKIIGIIAWIREKAGVDDRRIELRHFSTEFRASMILIDPGKGRKWGKLTLTLPPAKAIDSMSFYIRSKILNNKNSDNIYEQCEDHFDELWNKYENRIGSNVIVRPEGS